MGGERSEKKTRHRFNGKKSKQRRQKAQSLPTKIWTALVSYQFHLIARFDNTTQVTIGKICVHDKFAE
jgi:hypothetical protein